MIRVNLASKKGTVPTLYTVPTRYKVLAGSALAIATIVTVGSCCIVSDLEKKLKDCATQKEDRTTQRESPEPTNDNYHLALRDIDNKDIPLTPILGLEHQVRTARVKKDRLYYIVQKDPAAKKPDFRHARLNYPPGDKPFTTYDYNTAPHNISITPVRPTTLTIKVPIPQETPDALIIEAYQEKPEPAGKTPPKGGGRPGGTSRPGSRPSSPPAGGGASDAGTSRPGTDGGPSPPYSRRPDAGSGRDGGLSGGTPDGGALAYQPGPSGTTDGGSDTSPPPSSAPPPTLAGTPRITVRTREGGTCRIAHDPRYLEAMLAQELNAQVPAYFQREVRRDELPLQRGETFMFMSHHTSNGYEPVTNKDLAVTRRGTPALETLAHDALRAYRLFGDTIAEATHQIFEEQGVKFNGCILDVATDYMRK